MVDPSSLLPCPSPSTSYRLVNSKFPPIHLFDDVADASEFEAVYALQALTNPRLLTRAGDLNLVPREEIPWGIVGCGYAVAPFTHVNPEGSRFSDGSFGVLYVADTPQTALAEVCYHQERYWREVPELHFDRFVFRGLACTFECEVSDGTVLGAAHPVYAPDDYGPARQLGRAAWQQRIPAIRYPSVRNPGALCWALFTPRPVKKIIQAAHYEVIWLDGKIAGINQLQSAAR